MIYHTCVIVLAVLATLDFPLVIAAPAGENAQGTLMESNGFLGIKEAEEEDGKHVSAQGKSADQNSDVVSVVQKKAVPSYEYEDTGEDTGEDRLRRLRDRPKPLAKRRKKLRRLILPTPTPKTCTLNGCAGSMDSTTHVCIGKEQRASRPYGDWQACPYQLNATGGGNWRWQVTVDASTGVATKCRPPNEGERGYPGTGPEYHAVDWQKCSVV